MVSARHAARQLLSTRMALALGFGVLLTLLVGSGLNTFREISQLQSSNENILAEFLARENWLDQEALTNVCRHAHASSVEISIAGDADAVEVAIRDDGRGFRAPRAGGLGLIGIEERVESLGGRVAVRSEPGKGTAIEARLPLPRPVIADVRGA